MRVKIELQLDDYEWDGRTLLLKFVPSDYTDDNDPDPEQIIIEETDDNKLTVIGKKS